MAYSTQSFLFRDPNQAIILPGTTTQFSIAFDPTLDALWTLEPRPQDAWPPPKEIFSLDHAERVTGLTYQLFVL